MQPVTVQPWKPWFPMVLEDAIMLYACKLSGFLKCLADNLKRAPCQEWLQAFCFRDGCFGSNGKGHGVKRFKMAKEFFILKVVEEMIDLCIMYKLIIIKREVESLAASSFVRHVV